MLLDDSGYGFIFNPVVHASQHIMCDFTDVCSCVSERVSVCVCECAHASECVCVCIIQGAEACRSCGVVFSACGPVTPQLLTPVGNYVN